MGKATEDKLGELHGMVATVLTAQVGHKEKAMMFDENGEEVETGEEIYVAAPATIATAIKFLKDNNITADVDNNENMSNLAEKLAGMQQFSRKNAAKDANKLN